MTGGRLAPIMSVMQKISLVKKLMVFEALTLAVVSPIHLFEGSYKAGAAEGLICIALVIGLVRGRRAASAALCFAVFGFVVGLSETVGGGSALAVAYHATMLPVLIGTALLVRSQTRSTARRNNFRFPGRLRSTSS